MPSAVAYYLLPFTHERVARLSRPGLDLDLELAGVVPRTNAHRAAVCMTQVRSIRCDSHRLLVPNKLTNLLQVLSVKIGMDSRLNTKHQVTVKW